MPGSVPPDSSSAGKTPEMIMMSVQANENIPDALQAVGLKYCRDGRSPS
jgi:hypothetical protein